MMLKNGNPPEDLAQLGKIFDKLVALTSEHLSRFDVLYQQQNSSSTNHSDFDPVGLSGITQVMQELRTLTLTPLFQSVISEKPEQVLSFVLRIYRQYPPFLQPVKYPEVFRRLLLEQLKNGTDFLVSTSIKSSSFVRACLEKNLQVTDEAVPFLQLLSKVIFVLSSRRGSQAARWWMTVNDAGELRIVNQVFGCVGLLLPEICLPAVIKISAPTNLHTSVLETLCVLAAGLSENEMWAFRRSLATQLSCERPLVALLASDTLQFLAKIAPTRLTMHLVVDALHSLSKRLSGEQMAGDLSIIQMTCCRLIQHLSADEKNLIVEFLPIRRHFFIWSHIPAVHFLDTPEVIVEIYNECLGVLRETVESFPRSTATLGCLLCRLPLALESLCLLASSLDHQQRQSVPELVNFSKEITKIYPRLWKLLTAVDEILELVSDAFCKLIYLGALIQHELSDDDLCKVLEGCYLLPLEFGSFLRFGTTVVSRVGLHTRKRSEKVASLLEKIFVLWGLSGSLPITTACVSAFLHYCANTRCEKWITDFGRNNPDFVAAVAGYLGKKDENHSVQLMSDMQALLFPARHSEQVGAEN